MNAAPWMIGLAIALGSLAGALLRQAIASIFGRSRSAVPAVMLATTAIVGGAFGAVIGSVMATTTLAAEKQGIVLIGLVAALGTFGAAAVLATPSTAPQEAPKLWRTAALHIALAIFAAAAGIGLIRWLVGPWSG